MSGFWRALRWAWTLFGAASTVIGVAGIPDDLTRWASWLEPVDTELSRWVLGVVGLFILANAIQLADVVGITRRTALSHGASVDLPDARSPMKVEHDDMLWLDSGERYPEDGGIVADGPLCPRDRATLRYWPKDGAQGDIRNDTRSVDAHWDDEMGVLDGRLVCPECYTQYYQRERLTGKKLSTSKEEAEARLDGMRRSRKS